MLTSTEARTHLRAPSLKFTGIDGTFEGYASLFHVADQGRDIVLPGAFRDSLRSKGAGGIRLLFQHKPEEPIGVWEEIREDRRGLFVRGRIATATARGREVLALMRSGAIDGLSIGFRVVKARRDPVRRVRLIERVDLWEISVVTFPMLTGARIARVAMPGMATPIVQRGQSLPQEIAAMARRMRQRLTHARTAPLARRAANLAGEQVLVALMRQALLEQKFLDAKFNPSQPRLPSGQTGGGQWTSGEGGHGRAPDACSRLDRYSFAIAQPVGRVCARSRFPLPVQPENSSMDGSF